MVDLLEGLEERLARRDAHGAVIVDPHEYNEVALLSMLDHLVGPGRYLVHWNRDRSAGSRWPHAYVWAELGWWWKTKKAKAIELQIRVAFDLWVQVQPR